MLEGSVQNKFVLFVRAQACANRGWKEGKRSTFQTVFVLLLRFRPGAKVQFQPGAHGHVKDGACLFCSRDIFRLSLPVLPGRPRESRRDELGKARPLASFQEGKSRPGKRKECFEPKSLKALFLRSKAGTVSASAGKRRTGPLIVVLKAFLRRKEGRKGTVPPRTDAKLRSLTTAPQSPVKGTSRE